MGSEELLLGSPFTMNVTGWSRDGYILYSVDDDPKTGYDLWWLPMEKGVPGQERVFLNEPYEERGAQFSPAGHSIAYVSDETGRFEILRAAVSSARRSVAGLDHWRDHPALESQRQGAVLHRARWHADGRSDRHERRHN